MERFCNYMSGVRFTLTFISLGFTNFVNEVSRATLDIICATAFGYDSDSVHNPNDELSVAWHSVFALQSRKRIHI